MTLPLKDIKVLDLSSIIAAPVAATTLGDFGAEVIKIEEPRNGDFMRRTAPNQGGRSLQWVQDARNKASVTLDLRKPQAREIVHRLLPHFDVLVTNFRPPTLRRWGFDPETIRMRHPRLIALYVTGYGLTGPYSDRGAFDRIASAFSGLTYVSGDADRPPVRAGVITVSHHNRCMLLDAFPRASVERVRLSIEPNQFEPSNDERPLRIAYMPRRGREEARQLLDLLAGHRLLQRWEVMALDGLSHHQIAERLRATRIFLAFTHQEGFGLPAAEAMACGAYVIGNHGYGGSEFFRPEFCAPVANGDIRGFQRALVHALGAECANPQWCRARGMRASAFIHQTYSPQNERADVMAVYSRLLACQSPARDLFPAEP